MNFANILYIILFINVALACKSAPPKEEVATTTTTTGCCDGQECIAYEDCPRGKELFDTILITPSNDPEKLELMEEFKSIRCGNFNKDKTVCCDVTPEDLGEQPRTKFSNLDNDVIGDLISSAISNRKNPSNDLVDCSIYDENDGNMHLAHPTDCNKFFKCQKGKAIEFSCKADLYFDASINSCNWPSQVNCENDENFRQSTTPFPTTTAKTTTTTTKSNSRGGPVMRSSIDKSNDLSSTTVAKPKKQNEDQFTTQRSNRGRPPHATENPKNLENSSSNTKRTTTTTKPPTTKPCPFGDLVSCMDACTDDPDFSNSCIGICKERCPATTESCPGKNVEACLGACPSNLEAFGVCVRVCNWRCPDGGQEGVHGVQNGQGVRRDNCPPCPSCSSSPNFGGQDDYEEYDSTPYDEGQYEDYRWFSVGRFDYNGA